MSAAVTTRKAAEQRGQKSSSPAETRRKEGAGKRRFSKTEPKSVKSEENGHDDNDEKGRMYRRDGIPTGETPSNFLAACSKLDLEPNPFEQSFGVPSSSNGASSGGTQSSSKSNVLPPVAHLTSPSPLMPNTWGFNSLRSGPLSAGMLPGPQGSFDPSTSRTGLTPIESGIRTGLTPGGSGSMFPAPSPTTATLFGLMPGGTPGSTPGSAMTSQNMTNHNKMQSTNDYDTSHHHNSSHQSHQQGNGKGHAVDPDSAAANGLFLLSQAQEDEGSDDDNMLDSMPSSPDDKKRKNSLGTSQDGSTGKRVKVKRENNGISHSSRKQTDEEKRRSFLERNRQAALKCRQRKKQWLANLQGKVEFYSSENDGLSSQVGALREEIVNLKTLLLAHKDCAVAHANGAIGGIDAINQAISAPEFPGPPNMGMLRRF